MKLVFTRWNVLEIVLHSIHNTFNYNDDLKSVGLKIVNHWILNELQCYWSTYKIMRYLFLNQFPHKYLFFNLLLIINYHLRQRFTSVEYIISFKFTMFFVFYHSLILVYIKSCVLLYGIIVQISGWESLN